MTQTDLDDPALAEIAFDIAGFGAARLADAGAVPRLSVFELLFRGIATTR